MKWLFSLILVFFLSQNIWAKEMKATYIVKAKGLNIGELIWKYNNFENFYETNIILKNKGFLSGLYKFSGIYSSRGVVQNNVLISEEYNQQWKTSKKDKNVKILFENKKIKEILIRPFEKELIRVDIKELKNYSDPITSFINIMFPSCTGWL